MDMSDPPIQVEHPPHQKGIKKTAFLLWSFFDQNPPFPLNLFPLLLFLRVLLRQPLFSSFKGDRRPSRRSLLFWKGRGQSLKNVKLEDLATVIYEEATRYNHDPKFILALIAIESSFKNSSVSERGAKGLMQLMPYVAEGMAQELGIEWTGDHNLFDPIINVKLGIYYLSRLTNDFKNPGLALTAYNYGPSYTRSLVERRQRVPLHYYRRVLAFYQAMA